MSHFNSHPTDVTESMAGAILTIDLQALRHNYRLLRAQSVTAECGAVVKADAYGLGVAKVAPALWEEGCRHFFVAHLQEGIALRHLLSEATIYVMHGIPFGHEQDCLEHRCVPVLNSLAQIAAWRTVAAKNQTTLDAIVQLDTGMSRMGLSTSEVQALIDQPDLLEGIRVLYWMSHLACAETQSHPLNQRQLQQFQALRSRLPASKATLANSSGIYLGTDYHHDLLRPGAALYGVAPVAGQPNPMQPVVRLQGRIIQTRTITANTSVGYGATYLSPTERRIATVAVGYADGWLRSLSNRGAAVIDGKLVPMVGKVSMDTITLDVSDIAPEFTADGALVDLISAQNTVDAVAERAGTIGYEILTSLGARYARRYV